MGWIGCIGLDSCIGWIGWDRLDRLDRWIGGWLVYWIGRIGGKSARSAVFSGSPS